jgi:hypothetical protein
MSKNLYFQLIFDNYSTTPRPSAVLPASSYSKKTPVAAEVIENSSNKGSAPDLEELRQELQSTKKQSLVLMEQSRKSSEREQIALQQAQDALAEKETAVAEAAAASTRENFMLQPLTDASLDMAGVLPELSRIFSLFLVSSFPDDFFPNRFFCERCYRR